MTDATEGAHVWGEEGPDETAQLTQSPTLQKRLHREPNYENLRISKYFGDPLIQAPLPLTNSKTLL